jgi:cyclase
MESDIVLYLPEERILFTGDLVFVGMHPYLADGNASGLRQILTGMIENPIEIVVPGHGKAGGKADIQAMIDYIDMVEALVKDLKTQHRKPEDVSVEDIPEPFRDWQFANFFQANLNFLYGSIADR